MALIAGSIQDVIADESDDEYKQITLKDSEYQVHLQVIVRDTIGELVSVTEATSGHYIPAEITEQAFNSCFGQSICQKEIVIIDNKKYEKVPFAQKYNMDSSFPQMTIKIRAAVQTDENSVGAIDLFSILVPVIYTAVGDEISTQWSIVRELN